MRDINRIILHCSATREGTDISIETIRRWHLDRGWSDVGYHYTVRLDGTIEHGRCISKPGAHVRGHNKDSVGICYIGGLDSQGKPKNTMTDDQRYSIRLLCRALATVLDKPLTLHGHREFANKACPSFDVYEEFGELATWMECGRNDC